MALKQNVILEAAPRESVRSLQSRGVPVPPLLQAGDPARGALARSLALPCPAGVGYTSSGKRPRSFPAVGGGCG